MPELPEILVVDDDPVARDVLVTALELDGHHVVGLGDGEAALARLREHPVAAVVLDRRMPGTDGAAVLRSIRADPRTALIPVLLVTGMDEPHERVAGLDQGADDYIVKPFEVDEVVARVRAHLRGHRAWIDRLTSAVDERRAVLARAAERAGAADDHREAADLLCAELCAVPEVQGAVLVEIAGEHHEVLGSCGNDGVRLLQLAERPADLEALARGLPDGPRTAVLLDAVVVLAPVTVAGQTVAALVVTGDRTVHGSSDALLALAIDFGAIAGGVLTVPLRASTLRREARARFRRLLDGRAFHPVFQPVVRLSDGVTVGHEALTRFDAEADTERVFVEARRAGLGLEIEAATLEASLQAAMGQPSGHWLALNVTPSLILDVERLGELLDRSNRAAVVLEISELEPVHDYGALLQAVAALAVTVQLSVDDAGSGFASLAHILALGARYVKLDKSWVDGLDRDPAKRALVAGLQNFARETDASLIAEGIETPAQLAAARELGIAYGQGWLLGTPIEF